MCASIDFKKVFIQWQIDGGHPWDYHAKHHATSKALRKAAASGCRLCSLVLDADGHGRSGLAGERTIATDEMGPFHVGAAIDLGHSLHATPNVIRCNLIHRACYSANRYLPLTVKGTARVDSGPDYDLFQAWIHDCLGSHPRCKKTRDRGAMPTRLLDAQDVPLHGTVRLVESRDMSGTYVALSHVWGQKKPLTTTRDNYRQLLDGFSVTMLPLTFADAITVTGKLGYHYLWIDCLCIVQDDADDWQRESARMATVYANADLTIAAYDAQDATVGMFSRDRIFERSEESATLVLKADGDKSDFFVTVLPGSRDPAYLPKLSPRTALATRAWAVQERVLSPRILGLAPGRCYFECNEAYCGDRLPQPVLPVYLNADGSKNVRVNLVASIDRLSKTPYGVLGIWQAILTIYSRCDLTEGKDKLPAISAVAAVLSKSIGSKYIAGLWLEMLSHSLAWSCDGPYPQDCKPSIRPATHRAPSWSWASCDRPLKPGPSITGNGSIKSQWESPWTPHDILQGLASTSCFSWWVSCLTLHETEIQLVDERNPYGEVKGGRLVVSGETRPLDALAPRESHCMCYADSARHRFSGDWWFDAKAREASCSGKLVSLLLGCTVMKPQSDVDTVHIYALILQELAPSSDTFIRIGMSKQRWFRESGILHEPLTQHGEYRKITLV